MGEVVALVMLGSKPRPLTNFNTLSGGFRLSGYEPQMIRSTRIQGANFLQYYKSIQSVGRVIMRKFIDDIFHKYIRV